MPIVAVLMTALHLAASPAGQIAFLTSTEQDDRCVCVVDLASHEVRRVGQGTRDGAPAWSPDGTWIAYVTRVPEPGEGTGVRLVRPDGSGERLLKHGHAWIEGPPRWSPDGKKIAYSAGEGLNQRVMVYDPETDREVQWGGDQVSLLRPVWTGNERLLAVAVVGEPGKQTTDLYWVSPDGATPAPEVLATAGDYAEWSPDAQRQGNAVAYESNDGGDREIFVHVRGHGVVDVSNHRTVDWNPVWSPDGEWVAFESFRKGRRGIYRVSPMRILVYDLATDPQSDNWSPTWSPDGQWIAYVSNRSGVPKLYAAHVAGEEVRPLTDHSTQDLAPAWRPEARK